MEVKCCYYLDESRRRQLFWLGTYMMNCYWINFFLKSDRDCYCCCYCCQVQLFKQFRSSWLWCCLLSTIPGYSCFCLDCCCVEDFCCYSHIDAVALSSLICCCYLVYYCCWRWGDICYGLEVVAVFFCPCGCNGLGCWMSVPAILFLIWFRVKCKLLRFKFEDFLKFIAIMGVWVYHCCWGVVDEFVWVIIFRYFFCGGFMIVKCWKLKVDPMFIVFPCL